jgi:hypothetical protein
MGLLSLDSRQIMNNSSDRLRDEIISLIVNASSNDLESLQNTARLTACQLRANTIATTKGDALQLHVVFLPRTGVTRVPCTLTSI